MSHFNRKRTKRYLSDYGPGGLRCPFGCCSRYLGNNNPRRIPYADRRRLRSAREAIREAAETSC